MKTLRARLQGNTLALLCITLGICLTVFLLTYKLAGLVGGVSATESNSAVQIVGLHGIYSNPLYLPLKLVRSAVFALEPSHGQFLTRLPNVAIGAIAIGAFTWLIGLWYGRRTALFGGLLFATSAWTLHISRVATVDVLYLAAIPVLLLGYAALKRYSKYSMVLYILAFVYSLLIYIPGLLWIVVPTLIAERKLLRQVLTHHQQWWKQAIAVLISFLVLMPLAARLASKPALVREWLGAPESFSSLQHMAKEVIAVPVHLLIRGPENPELWLGRMPIFDIFMLALAVIGAFFYIRHIKSTRTILFIAYAVIGTALIALGGAVSLSLLVPLVFLLMATGLKYLLHEWFSVFPKNPVPQNFGMALIVIAVILSCSLNIRAYFVAWPHATNTAQAFQYHR